MKNRLYQIYAVTVCIVLMIPAVGMMFWPTNETTENTPMVEKPSFIVDGSPNTNWLADWGAWFENHYAFRQHLITANSLLYTELFNTSPVEKVLPGQDDWLFYRETLADYTGENLLSERELFNIVHNLKLMQWSAETQGASFMVTVCPNKSTIYPEKMDSGYIAGSRKNLDLFAEAMEANGIPYTDLSSVLTDNKEEMIYYQRDSHWSQTGALFGYTQLMNSLGLAPKEYTATGSAVHKGDLDEMLLPKAWHEEQEDDYSGNFTYQSSTEDNMEEFIHTSNPLGQGTLLMFRDSFGTNIIPYLADTWAQAYFSRLVPYNLVQIQSLKPNTVIVERVERRIRSFEESAPVMIMPGLSKINAVETGETLRAEMVKQGDFVRIHGQVPVKDPNDEFYLQISDTSENLTQTVPVFYTVDGNRNNGFDVYLLKNQINSNDRIEIVKTNQDTAVSYAVRIAEGEEK